MPHPNLWSWRDLMTRASGNSTFLAFFVADANDPTVDQNDARFRQLLAN